MKQLIQHLKTGETVLEDVPVPQVSRGYVLIQTRRSLVSLGTERMLVDFGKANLLTKARQQPERVKQVFDKIRADGLRPTLEAVFRKLDQPLPMGYSNAGVVLSVGSDVTDLRPGDRVVSNGHHAEVVCVPRNLVAPIPDQVSDDEAAFTIIGAIGLQGIRLLNPTLGETVVVIGLGLIGLLTAQLLRLNGFRVIGIDIDETKCRLAQQQGILTVKPINNGNPANSVLALTDQLGADGVLITASAKDDTIMAQAAQMSRKRGRIVLVGVVDLHLNRADFYEKELTFQVSCSYGPGRYDTTYEQQGHDYPYSYVRWTENRNFQAILQWMASKQLDVTPLISETVALADYQQIYNDIHNKTRIASLLAYPERIDLTPTIQLRPATFASCPATVGLIGAGNFANAVLIPALQQANAHIKTIASANGLNATLLAKKHRIPESTSDYQHMLNDPAINLCVIATRHHNHAQLVIDALRSGKHVFVEKPLAIYEHDIYPIIEAQQIANRLVMVGFNRRFSPYVQKIKTLLQSHTEQPISVTITINAGFIPQNNWVHDRAIGGGRILGEACHFIDLITFLTESNVRYVCMNAMGKNPTETTDSVTLMLRYKNGSIGTINYFSNGHKAYAKERVEVYSQGRTLILDNFRELTGFGFKGFSRMRGRQNKGHVEQMQQLINWLQNPAAQPPVSLADSINTTQTTLGALQSLREKSWVDVATIGMTAEPMEA